MDRQEEHRRRKDADSAPSAGFERSPAAHVGDVEWDELRKRVLAVVRGIVKDNHGVDAEDITQIVIDKAWERRASFEGRSQFSTWLHRIAVNEALDALRRVRHNVLSLDERKGGEATVPEPEDARVDIVQIILCNELLNIVPPEQAKLLTQWMENVPVELIGEQLGISADAVRHRIARALRRIVERTGVPNRTGSSTAVLKPVGKAGSNPKRNDSSQKE